MRSFLPWRCSALCGAQTFSVVSSSSAQQNQWGGVVRPLATRSIRYWKQIDSKCGIGWRWNVTIQHVQVFLFQLHLRTPVHTVLDEHHIFIVYGTHLTYDIKIVLCWLQDCATTALRITRVLEGPSPLLPTEFSKSVSKSVYSSRFPRDVVRSVTTTSPTQTTVFKNCTVFELIHTVVAC